MKTKLTILGDPHFKNDNLHLQEKIFEKLEKIGNPVLILGDLLHSKEIIRGNSLNALVRILSKSKLNFYILVGNHDLFNLNTTEHSLESLKLLPNVKIIDFPQILEFGELKIACIPYIHDLAKLREEIDKVRSEVPMLIMHAGINNFDYGNGYLETNSLNIDELKDFKLVLCGHFHKHAKQDNIMYMGTPFSHDFGESNQDKYIGVLDLKSLKIELIKTNLPAHITKEVSSIDELKKITEKLDSKNFNRIILKGNPKDFAGADLASFAKENISIIERYSSEVLEVKTLDNFSPLALFEDWAKNIKKMDKNLIDLGIEILKNV